MAAPKWLRRYDMKFCVWCETELDNPTENLEVWNQHRWECRPALESGAVMDAPNQVTWSFPSRQPFVFKWQPLCPYMLWIEKSKDETQVWRGVGVAPGLQNEEGVKELSRRFILSWEATQKERDEGEAATETRKVKHEIQSYLSLMVKSTAEATGMKEGITRRAIQSITGELPDDLNAATAVILNAVEMLCGDESSDGQQATPEASEPKKESEEVKPKPAARKPKSAPKKEPTTPSLFDVL